MVSYVSILFFGVCVFKSQELSTFSIFGDEYIYFSWVEDHLAQRKSKYTHLIIPNNFLFGRPQEKLLRMICIYYLFYMRYDIYLIVKAPFHSALAPGGAL